MLGQTLALLILLLGCTFFALGANELQASFQIRRRIRKMRSWNTTAGCVFESRVVPDLDGTYELRVSYEYEVAYTAYQNNAVWCYRRVFTTRDAAEQMRREYLPGQAVTVTFEPARPCRSVLDFAVPAQNAAGPSRFCIGAFAMVCVLVWAVIR